MCVVGVGEAQKFLLNAKIKLPLTQAACHRGTFWADLFWTPLSCPPATAPPVPSRNPLTLIAPGTLSGSQTVFSLSTLPLEKFTSFHRFNAPFDYRLYQ